MNRRDAPLLFGGLMLGVAVAGFIVFLAFLVTQPHHHDDELRARCEASGGTLIEARKPLHVCVRTIPMSDKYPHGTERRAKQFVKHLELCPMCGKQLHVRTIPPIPEYQGPAGPNPHSVSYIAKCDDCGWHKL